MSGGPGLERRYRRVLRLLPGYYRDRWEQDMVAAFLDSWLTGDPEEDQAVLEFCKPTWAEVASVVGLAVRLYLGGAGAPRRYFAWGQAVRRAVLTVVLVHAVLAVDALIRQAYDSGDAVGMSVAGQLWQAPQPRSRVNALRAEQIILLSRNQAFQLYRLLVPSG